MDRLANAVPGDRLLNAFQGACPQHSKVGTEGGGRAGIDKGRGAETEAHPRSHSILGTKSNFPGEVPATVTPLFSCSLILSSNESIQTEHLTDA